MRGNHSGNNLRIAISMAAKKYPTIFSKKEYIIACSNNLNIPEPNH